MRLLVSSVLFLLTLLTATPLSAQQAPASPGAAPTSGDGAARREAELHAAITAADAAAIQGPNVIKLSDKGTLRLPAGMSWVPRGESDRFMRASGHPSNPDLIGIITGATSGHGWLAIVDFTSEGYVKDDDSKNLDPAKLLASLRETTEENNKSRVERGFLPLVLDDGCRRRATTP